MFWGGQKCDAMTDDWKSISSTRLHEVLVEKCWNLIDVVLFKISN